MAKEKSTPLQECAKCASSTTHNGTLYCTLMLQDAKIYKDSGKVSKQYCIWFKHKEVIK